MTHLVVDCDAAVSAGQRAELEQGLPRDRVQVRQHHEPAEPGATGTVTLILTFATKRFFDAFFSELGKDVHGWFTTKSNMMRAANCGPLRVEYRLHGDEILFVDEMSEWNLKRHERVLGVIDTAWRVLQDRRLWQVKCVQLIFDTEKNAYTEARLCRCDYERLGGDDEADVQTVLVLRF